MKTLKEIYAEAKNYAPDNEALREAFVQGARFMATGKYYKEQPMFKEENNVETVDLQVTVTEIATVFQPSKNFGKLMRIKKVARKQNRNGTS